MPAPSTTAVLAGLLALLEGALAGQADAFDRYDGSPVDAVEEHVAELRGAAGASVLVGFLADDDVRATEAGEPLAATLQPSVIVVRRRAPRDVPENETSARADAEALDALYDAALRALADSPWRLTRGQALAGDTRDWFGRAIVCRKPRPFPPGA